MTKPQGMIVCGANGSGKTTVGRELARLLNFKHIDHEDYHFMQSAIPYTIERSRDECISLMLRDIEKHRSFVISAVTGDFGDEIQAMYKLAVFITAPLEIRIKRIEQRGHERYGDRVRAGGDMYEQQQRFADFVASRSLTAIEHWTGTLTCPVIRVDGTVDWRKNAVFLAEQFEFRRECKDGELHGYQR